MTLQLITKDHKTYDYVCREKECTGVLLYKAIHPDTRFLLHICSVCDTRYLSDVVFPIHRTIPIYSLSRFEKTLSVKYLKE